VLCLSFNTHFLAKEIICNNGIWKRGPLEGSWIRQEKIDEKLENKRHNEELLNTFQTQLLG